MRIEGDDRLVSWDDVVRLFSEVGWGIRNPGEVRTAFQHSTFKVFAFEDGKLVGFGRTVDDGRFYATIVDVVVSPAYQKRGIGRAILEDLQAQLNGFLVVTLTAAPPVQRFYRRLGWRQQTTAMILPRSEEQARANCSDESRHD